MRERSELKRPIEDTLEPVAAILCTGGPDVIRKEAWPLYRTISGVRLCWELEEPKGLQAAIPCPWKRMSLPLPNPAFAPGFVRTPPPTPATTAGPHTLACYTGVPRP